MSGLEVSHYTLLIPEAILNAPNSMHAGGIVSLRASKNLTYTYSYSAMEGYMRSPCLLRPSLMLLVPLLYELWVQVDTLNLGHVL